MSVAGDEHRHTTTMTDATQPDDVTPRTVIHDATLSVYDPETLPDFDVFSAVVDVSADSIEAVSGVDA